MPAVLGAVFVQLAAVVAGAASVFWFAPTFPALSALALPIVVVATVCFAFFMGARGEKKGSVQEYERSSGV